MTYLILNGELKEKYAEVYDEIVPMFINTGAEHPDTYRFIEDCVKHWGWDNFVSIQYHIDERDRKYNTYEIVPFEKMNRDGSLMKQVNEQYQSFSFMRHCTREMKQRVADKFKNTEYKWAVVDTAVGIRADEMRRYKKKLGWRYPLIEDIPTTKPEILDFFSDYDFDLRIPEHLGNCVFCFCKTDKKVCKAIQDMRGTPLFENWRAMDRLNKSEKGSYRGFKTFEHLIEMSEAIGEIDDRMANKWEGGCSESCEFFDLE